MSLQANIWEAAASQVRNPSRVIKFGHWGAEKWRKNKKPGNVIKTGTTVTTGFITLPIPLWTSGVDYVVQKVEGKVRAHYRKKNLVNAEEPIKKVKHGIKNLDVSKLDRARYKAQHSFSRVDKYFRGNDKSLSKCVGLFQFAYQFHYARSRMVKLRFQAEVMKSLSDAILEWCDKTEMVLDTAEPTIIDMIGDRLGHTPAECGGIGASSGCFNAEGNDTKLQNSINKLVSMPEVTD